MKQFLIFLIVIFGATLLADWDVGDPDVMHFPQLPDDCGTDIYFGYHDCTVDAQGDPLYDSQGNPLTVNKHAIADDWIAINDGPVTDIHFWYSWLDTDDNWASDNVGDIVSVHVEIFEVDPLNPNLPKQLPSWTRAFYVGEFEFRSTNFNGSQSFASFALVDPANPVQLTQDNHWYTWQMNLIMDPLDQDLFLQFAGTRYWLSVSVQVATVPPGEIQFQAGWKTSNLILHEVDPGYIFGAPAVYRYLCGWYPMQLIDYYSPGTVSPDPEYKDLAFVITGTDGGLPVELSSFTGIFNSELCSSTLNWTTQSESQNMGWYVYRGESNNPEEALMLNGQMIQGAGNSTEPTYYQYDDLNDLEFDSNYWYWIESVAQDGSNELMGPIVVKTLSEEFNPDPPDLKDQFGLLQNYPNPFNPVTYFQFKLPEDCVGTLEVYDIKGRKVATVFTDQSLEKDSVDPIRWVAEDDSGIALNSGIYFYKLKTSDEVFTKKMIIIK